LVLIFFFAGSNGTHKLGLKVVTMTVYSEETLHLQVAKEGSEVAHAMLVHLTSFNMPQAPARPVVR
jgi:hypothetical protein